MKRTPHVAYLNGRKQETKHVSYVAVRLIKKSETYTPISIFFGKYRPEIGASWKEAWNDLPRTKILP